MDIDLATLTTGLLIFFARVFDVTLGTLRTISTVQGRTRVAFGLGLFEVTTWLVVISTVIDQIAESPVLGVFYAIGFSTGNVVGILVERRLAMGQAAVRVIAAKRGAEIAERLRELGLRVTSFSGSDQDGPVNLLFVVCDRRRVREVLALIWEVEPDALHTVDMVGPTGRTMRPMMQPATGWRAVIKRK